MDTDSMGRLIPQMGCASILENFCSIRMDAQLWSPKHTAEQLHLAGPSILQPR